MNTSVYNSTVRMLILTSCPGPVVGEEYELEYGTDRIEMHVGAVQPGERCLIVDDLIATGGTLAAGIRLLGDVAIIHAASDKQL